MWALHFGSEVTDSRLPHGICVSIARGWSGGVTTHTSKSSDTDRFAVLTLLVYRTNFEGQRLLRRSAPRNDKVGCRCERSEAISSENQPLYSPESVRQSTTHLAANGKIVARNVSRGLMARLGIYDKK
jgi:hypothetical protein